MLRISRKVGERVRIGEDVVIEVLEVTGSAVRLGVDAPRSIAVYREELWLSIKAENEAAGQVPTPQLPATDPPAK
jgi:carbon storage regulator